MSNPKMHSDELIINQSIVKKLLSDQFPNLADFPIQKFQSSGTDNSIYRLGENMMIRLPLTLDSAGRVAKEHEWLPKLSPRLPLPVPVPIALGKLSSYYPAPWSIYPWFEGEPADFEKTKNSQKIAAQLADFINSMQKINSTGGPLPGPHNFFRGVPLSSRDDETRAAIEALHGSIDTNMAIAAWNKAMKIPVWDKDPVWIHGDLLPGNLLVKSDQLTAIIDFGGLGLGDPAYDLIQAWCLFSAETREYFKSLLNVDNATWERGRGLALSIGLIALPYYRTTNPEFAKVAELMIYQALSDN